MEQTEITKDSAAEAGEERTTLSRERVQDLIVQIEGEQNLPLAVIGGLAAALVGAAIWAGVTVATKFQIGWMAVGVGFLVGAAVRALGKGVTPTFGYVGAFCALLGCALGNLLSACGFLAVEESLSYLKVVLLVLSSPSAVAELMKVTFSPMDLLFYGIAVYEGYRFSFRLITQEELAARA